jgi:endonuclease III
LHTAYGKVGRLAGVSNLTKSERIAYIDARLQSLYPKTPIPLDHSDPYTLLIAVLLSAQCTDERVNQVTPALFEKADSADKMVRLSVELIRGIIKPCGLSPQKSKAIHRLSEILLEQYGGEVPPDMVALETLPGVGHKTASVVMAQAFGLPTFPVDTHIHRLSQRWGLTRGRSVVETERDLKRAFPASRWNALHLQIIFYGRQYCTARGCDGRVCEICRTCYPTRKHPKRYNKP